MHIMRRTANTRQHWSLNGNNTRNVKKNLWILKKLISLQPSLISPLWPSHSTYRLSCQYRMQGMLRFITCANWQPITSRYMKQARTEATATFGMKQRCYKVATCLLDYMKTLASTVTHLSTFSDTCGGQNRNRFICAAMLYATKVTSLELIDLKYLESGHSYLEADSMHSTIERAKRHQKIYSTREWEVLISAARRNPEPYNVKRLTHEDFQDFKDLSKQTILNRTRNVDGHNVNWMKIKQLRFSKSKPYIVQYKYELSADTFMERNVRGISQPDESLKPAYSTRLPISEAKSEWVSRV